MFNPGETIGQKFVIPFNDDDIEKVIVSYKQNEACEQGKNNIIFEKTITSGFEQGSAEGTSEFTVLLSQEESLLFRDEQNYYIQINVLTTDGTRASSKLMKGKTGPQFHKEVIPNA